MKMREKLCVVLLMSAIFVALMASNVFAASFKTELDLSSPSAAKGGMVTVTIKITNIQDSGNGIYEYSAILDYDNTVFEEITDADIIGNDWQKSYVPDTKKVTFTRDGFVTADQEIGSVQLKIKSDTEAGSGTFALKEVKASNSEGDIVGTEVTTVITIGNEPIIQPIIGGGENAIQYSNTINPDPVENDYYNEDNEIGNLYVNENTSSGSDVPYTGLEDYMVPAVAAVIVLGTISFVNYRRLRY